MRHPEGSWSRILLKRGCLLQLVHPQERGNVILKFLAKHKCVGVCSDGFPMPTLVAV